MVSITVDGKVFNRFAAPSRYELSRLGPNGHNQNRIVENGVIIESASNTPTWNSNALAAFSSPNMNFIFESDGNGRNICSDFDQALTTDAQVQSIFYDNLQVVNQDGIIAISTRNANSCIYIEVLGAETFGGPEIVLSRFFARPGPSIVGPVFGQPAVGADYWRSGRVNANNGNIGIALFRLNEVAPLGSYITGIRYIGANVNHGDGKVFLIRSESADLSVVKTVNNLTPDYGDEIDFSIKAINNGLLNANGIQVTDLLPSGFNFISASTSRGTYNNTTGIWNIGSLNYGDVETLVIRARVNTTGDYTNLAQISSGPNDPNLENNISKVKVRPRNIVVANNLTVSTVANNPDAGNALDNDLFNGNPILPREVNIRSVSPSNPLVTIDVDNGTITVGNVPSGLYTIIYTICEAETDPENTNCSTATVTVLVSNELVASDDSLISSANNNNIGNIFEDNGNGPDVLNGETVTILNVSIRNVIASNPLVTVDVATGNIMVGDVPVGTYQIEYTICETGTDPAESNCSTATVTVEVRNLIVANDDLVTTSANNPNAGNVLEDNGNGADTFNGTELTAGQVSISVVSTSNPLVTLDTATGNISVGNVVSGSYTIDYTICETGTNPAGSNCSTATVTVEVRNLIVANDDLVTTSANNPNAGNVLEDNGNGADTFNGTELTAGQVSVSVVSTSNPLVTLDTATGNISVGNVVSGSYTIDYTICETGTNPAGSNCSTATVTVEVRNLIVANDDLLTTAANNPNAGNVLEDNGNGADTFNGKELTASQVSVLVVSTSNPLVTLDTATGNISVGNVGSGSYTIDYTICETGTNPAGSNCSTATVTVEVHNLIVANDDLVTTAANNPNAGNVLKGNGNGADTFNGTELTDGQVSVSVVSTSNPLVTLDTATGNISVGNVVSGSYTIDYTICETGTDPAESNCSTATVTVEVRNLIVANDDLVTTAANNPNAGNVLEDNGNGADTFNGKGLTAGQVSISVVSTSHPLVTLDTATGNIVVGEVGGGTFEVAYSICEIGSNPVNCKSAVVTVIVEIEDIKIEANDDIVQDVRGKSGAVNIINILDNDLLNGEAINLSDVIISVSGNQVLNPIPFTNSNSLPESNVVLNPDGSVNVAADTEPDTYVLDYSICSSSDPSICDTATIRVIVQVSSIIANDDNYGPLNGILGATFGNVIENDSINGIPVNLSDVILSWLSGSPELTLNEDGSITLASNTPSGEYILLYNLCEARDPNNCVTAIVKVVVIGEVDLSIEKTSNGIEVWGSEVFEYLITVSNIGLADATNVTIEDLLPEGIDFESQEVKSSISSLEINFEQQGNKLIWTLPVLPVNVNVDIRLNVLAQNIEGTKPFVVINNATVKGEELETNLNNNSATDINAINPFFIPNVFTPNGNGVNDTFEIVGINKFVKNDLVIFNRFGDEIFHAENYRNNWDASGLVAGTYFYVLRGVDRFGVNQEFKGWIQVVKK
ncbi:gliding motility-associated C-terminal domain-containing protein [Cecembia calidifontis]|uniref:T9SS type B sorting domain-containing protein n=1 Tax=Cecembia calidifontis TaxID=1187080 RepID=UPI0013EE50DB|nr:gliding motility-associated C-terminal domain-containing protein [Cecembia calidifontis]